MNLNHGISVYTQAFPDENGLVFTPECFSGVDASEALQAAIYQVYDERHFGILYIKEGTYPITKTIYIPRSVRLIGFGTKRPMFVLPKNTPGFDGSGTGPDRGGYNSPGYPSAVCMFWFTSNRPTEENPPADASAGTFYSAMANVDFHIEEGNPMAVCVRAHFAQNAFVSHVDFHVGDGLAALYEVGNEMENLAVYGGQYGILCRSTSPSWPFVLMDSTFVGQKKAAVASWSTGMTMFRIHVKDSPFGMKPFGTNNWEKIYMEDCAFENISDAVVAFDLENNKFTSVNLRRVYCKNAPVLALQRETGKKIRVNGDMYKVNEYIHGAVSENISEMVEIKSKLNTEALSEWIETLTSDIPRLPKMDTWVSVKEFGAVGDGAADDTVALQKAADSGKTVFFPEGFYRVADTVTMADGTGFIGMNPISTQIVLADDTPKFMGFGAPLPLIQSSKGENLIYCLGIDTGGKNPRVVGIKWIANEKSYMNDIKFVGGHGQLPKEGNPWGKIYNANKTGDFYPDKEWDYQYASLWITDGGGGIFKNIWSASPYAESGITITNTKTGGKIYCSSLEHHVRHEMKMRNVENWDFHAMQTEEEKAEGLEALPIEMVNCKNILFSNLWIFRTVYVNRPYPHAIRVWSSSDIEFANIHNYTQMQYTFDTLIHDPVKNLDVAPWEAAQILITGKEAKNENLYNGFEKIAGGLGFGSGGAVDSKGNLYFCDSVHKRIYRYFTEEKHLELLCDLFWRPMSVVFDTEDNMVVVADVEDLRSTVPGQRPYRRATYHPYYMWFGKRGAKVYSIDPSDPYNTMNAVEPTQINGLNPEIIYRPAHAWTPVTFLLDAEKGMENYYMLPDGKTAIAGLEDIGRSLWLNPVFVGSNKPFLAVDDGITRTYAFDTTKEGNLVNPRIFAENGRHGALVGDKGKVFIPEGRYLYKYENGVKTDTIIAPDRITSAAQLPNGKTALICRESVWIMDK